MAPPWNLIDQPSLCISSREIDSTVLSKTLENLDIRVDAAIPNGQAWYLPVSPALSFLTALRAFVVKVNEDSPLKCLSLTRRDGDDYDVFLLRIEFEKRHKGKKAKELGLQEKYRLDTRGKSLQGVCKAFDDLVHCRTGEVCFTRIAEVVDKKELEAVFANGTPHPCVGVIFGKFGATLCWAGQPKDCENSE
jgi:hypothetical protein